MNRSLRGIELRYILTMHLFDNGPTTVAQMVNMLATQGFRTNGRASKLISDALRWEREHGRVRRLGRGRYGPASMPRGTEHRIHKRASALRAEAEAGVARSRAPSVERQSVTDGTGETSVA